MSLPDRPTHLGSLPTGIVTFLFTDIEGSTRKWEDHPAEMSAALSTHNGLVREAIAANDGMVFETAGDSFVAVFERPVDGVCAAVDAQVALAAAAWPEAVGNLSVRMAVDTGPAELRPDGYAAQHTLSRLSRILAAGHGGQILTSAATRAAVDDDVPDGITMSTLGEHSLRDLAAPQEVVQVLAPGPPWNLPADFPPLRTLRWNNLPAQLNPFIGREHVVAGVVDLLLSKCRLVTLTGPGGTGKTRVALQSAATVADAFDHGVVFVNLAPVRDVDRVMATVAMSVGVTEVAGTPIATTLKASLRDRRFLLVLDNFEQVVGAAPQVADLAGAAAGLSVLTTSRVPLRISGEREHPVPTFDLPDRSQLPPLDQLAEFESIRLFVERASAIKPGFVLSADNAHAIAEVCVRLDGLPLAIELAAARIRLLTPHTIASRLKNRLSLLTGGTSDADDRQRTLRGAISWSFELLSRDEQQLFARLAVFRGGRTLPAIEAVCADDPDTNVLDAVESLVNNNLLKAEDGPDGEPRFVMLETIHEFALEQLTASGDLELLRSRHARFFVELAESIDYNAPGPIAEGAEFERLEIEFSNLRSAMEWTLAGADEGDAERSELAARIVVALHGLWYIRGHWVEANAWALAAAEKVGNDNPVLRARVLLSAGGLAVERGDYATGLGLFEEAEPLLRQGGDYLRAAFTLGRVGDCMYALGDIASARPLIAQAVEQSRALDDHSRTARLMSSLAELSRAEGDYVEARRINESAVALLAESGYQGTSSHAGVQSNLGFAMVRAGDTASAAATLAEALTMLHRLGCAIDSGLSLLGLAGVAVAMQQPDRAARLFGAADRIFDELGAHLWPADRLDYEHYLAVAKAQMDDAAFEQARREGRSMTRDAAVELALNPEV